MSEVVGPADTEQRESVVTELTPRQRLDTLNNGVHSAAEAYMAADRAATEAGTRIVAVTTERTLAQRASIEAHQALREKQTERNIVLCELVERATDISERVDWYLTGAELEGDLSRPELREALRARYMKVEEILGRGDNNTPVLVVEVGEHFSGSRERSFVVSPLKPGVSFDVRTSENHEIFPVLVPGQDSTVEISNGDRPHAKVSSGWKLGIERLQHTALDPMELNALLQAQGEKIFTEGTILLVGEETISAYMKTLLAAYDEGRAQGYREDIVLTVAGIMQLGDQYRTQVPESMQQAMIRAFSGNIKHIVDHFREQDKLAIDIETLKTLANLSTEQVLDVAVRIFLESRGTQYEVGLDTARNWNEFAFNLARATGIDWLEILSQIRATNRSIHPITQ